MGYLTNRGHYVLITQYTMLKGHFFLKLQAMY
jgi:hypothetical protein